MPGGKFRATTQAGTISQSLGGRGGAMKGAVLLEGRLYAANRSTIDPGAPHGDKEDSVKSCIASK